MRKDDSYVPNSVREVRFRNESGISNELVNVVKKICRRPKNYNRENQLQTSPQLFFFLSVVWAGLYFNRWKCLLNVSNQQGSWYESQNYGSYYVHEKICRSHRMWLAFKKQAEKPKGEILY